MLKPSDRLDWRQAADFLGVRPFTIRAWVRERKVPFYRIGRNIYFSRRKLRTWQDRRTIAVEPARRVS
jgi:excisionase family DNA binding protein